MRSRTDSSSRVDQLRARVLDRRSGSSSVKRDVPVLARRRDSGSPRRRVSVCAGGSFARSLKIVRGSAT